MGKISGIHQSNEGGLKGHEALPNSTESLSTRDTGPINATVNNEAFLYSIYAF